MQPIFLSVELRVWNATDLFIGCIFVGALCAETGRKIGIKLVSKCAVFSVLELNLETQTLT